MTDSAAFQIDGVARSKLSRIQLIHSVPWRFCGDAGTRGACAPAVQIKLAPAIRVVSVICLRDAREAEGDCCHECEDLTQQLQ